MCDVPDEITERLEKYGKLDKYTKELIQAAVTARKYAYAPYSDFKVGAAFRTKCGRIFSGCNVEIAALSPSTCAVHTAINKAVSEGYREFTTGAVVAFQSDVFTMPCGACLQVIQEHATKDVMLFIAQDKDGILKNPEDPVLCTSLFNLLPKKKF